MNVSRISFISCLAILIACSIQSPARAESSEPAASGTIKAWQQEFIIPTYAAGEPEPNPMFYFGRSYQGEQGRVYPHPLYDTLSLASDVLALTNAQANDMFFNNNAINFSDLSGGSLATDQYPLITSDALNRYSGLTIAGDGTITAGLSIDTGLSAYPGVTLQRIGNNIVLNITAVPEPASLELLAAGKMLLMCLIRHDRK